VSFALYFLEIYLELVAGLFLLLSLAGFGVCKHSLLIYLLRILN